MHVRRIKTTILFASLIYRIYFLVRVIRRAELLGRRFANDNRRSPRSPRRVYRFPRRDGFATKRGKKEKKEQKGGGGRGAKRITRNPADGSGTP